MDIKQLDSIVKNVRPSSAPKTTYKYFGINNDNVTFSITYKPKRGQPETEIWYVRFDDEYGYFLSPKDGHQNEEFIADPDETDPKKIASSFKSVLSNLLGKTSKTYSSMFDESIRLQELAGILNELTEKKVEHLKIGDKISYYCNGIGRETEYTVEKIVTRPSSNNITLIIRSFYGPEEIQFKRGELLKTY
jgi:hypothetical protein